jgi:sigma-B regulation protein RsbU (phosphoserine phosphatase)
MHELESMTRRLLHIRESLASRITLRVVLYVVVVIGISAYVGNYYVLKIVKAIQEGGILYAIGMRRMAIALTAVFLLTMVVLTYLLRRTIHRLIAPLTTFTQAADEVARGNLQAKLPEIHSNDEMYYLRQSFSTMQQSLAQQMEELKQVNEAKGRMEGELKVARDMQLSMLPKAYSPTADSRLDIYGSLTPAREVGGDLYDFFVRDGKLFFCIGDVSGKGVPAALVMAQTMCQFRIVASYIDDVNMITTYINKIMSDGNDTMVFVTFFVGVLDPSTGHLEYCNAGHNKPLVNGQFLDAKPGLPLGVEENATYEAGECEIPVGTMLFLYTDGLTEAMTEKHDMFGSQRLIGNLQSDLDCKAQIERMTQAVHDFVGDAPQSDDLTMLAIKYYI